MELEVIQGFVVQTELNRSHRLSMTNLLLFKEKFYNVVNVSYLHKLNILLPTLESLTVNRSFGRNTTFS